MGFNDLGILLSCDLREAPGGKKCHDPLRFIGIDASPFSVAKSLVLAEMLRMLSEKHGLESWMFCSHLNWYSCQRFGVAVVARFWILYQGPH